MGSFLKKEQWVHIEDILGSLERYSAINEYLKGINREREAYPDEKISYMAFIASMCIFSDKKDLDSLTGYIASTAINIAEKRNAEEGLISRMKKEYAKIKKC